MAGKCWENITLLLPRMYLFCKYIDFRAVNLPKNIALLNNPGPLLLGERGEIQRPSTPNSILS